MIKQYGVSIDAANRHDYLQAKINDVRTKLDKVLARLYKARQLKRDMTIPERGVFDELLKQRAELVEQINGLYKQLED